MSRGPLACDLPRDPGGSPHAHAHAAPPTCRVGPALCPLPSALCRGPAALPAHQPLSWAVTQEPTPRPAAWRGRSTADKGMVLTPQHCCALRRLWAPKYTPSGDAGPGSGRHVAYSRRSCLQLTDEAAQHRPQTKGPANVRLPPVPPAGTKYGPTVPVLKFLSGARTGK